MGDGDVGELCEVETLLRSRIRDDGKKVYEVKWKGKHHGYNSWMTYEELKETCPDLMRNVDKREMSKRPRRIPWFVEEIEALKKSVEARRTGWVSARWKEVFAEIFPVLHELRQDKSEHLRYKWRQMENEGQVLPVERRAKDVSPKATKNTSPKGAADVAARAGRVRRRAADDDDDDDYNDDDNDDNDDNDDDDNDDELAAAQTRDQHNRNRDGDGEARAQRTTTVVTKQQPHATRRASATAIVVSQDALESRPSNRKRKHDAGDSAVIPKAAGAVEDGELPRKRKRPAGRPAPPVKPIRSSTPEELSDVCVTINVDEDVSDEAEAEAAAEAEHPQERQPAATKLTKEPPTARNQEAQERHPAAAPVERAKDIRPSGDWQMQGTARAVPADVVAAPTDGETGSDRARMEELMDRLAQKEAARTKWKQQAIDLDREKAALEEKLRDTQEAFEAIQAEIERHEARGAENAKVLDKVKREAAANQKVAEAEINRLKALLDGHKGNAKNPKRAEDVDAKASINDVIEKISRLSESSVLAGMSRAEFEALLAATNTFGGLLERERSRRALCIVCKTALARVVTVPCGHIVTCELCADGDMRACPQCHRGVESCIVPNSQVPLHDSGHPALTLNTGALSQLSL